jgi:hypothetical protein
MRIRGQALSELQGSLLLAGVLVLGGGGIWWWLSLGQANGVRDFTQVLNSARNLAQAGPMTLALTPDGTQTDFTIRDGSDPNGTGAIERSGTFTGTFTIASAGPTYSGSITFVLSSDGSAQIYGVGSCPANMKLEISGAQSYPVSCDPLEVVGG